MKDYRIPVVWEMWGVMEVDAKSLEEAKEKALDGGLPEGYYVDDSMQIDADSSILEEQAE